MSRALASIARRLAPQGMRKAVAAEVIEGLRAGFRAQLAAQPQVELGARHLASTVVLPDREAMLERLPKGGRVAEIGVAAGDFTAEILARTAPERLDLVDVWGSARYSGDLMESVARRFAGEIDAGRVRMHRGLSTEIGPGFADGCFDWVYIDTDHSYATTRDELALYAAKVKPGGILAGHDYTSGSWVSLLPYGVIAAVHEFCVAEDWELLYLTAEQRVPPSFAIRRIGG
ncbi:hypothetical protein LNKW23_05160 [Paralimibaculum aggregatum]|uniref:Class I SAM-dependent methyltransferase n=1 Tax=Paralimibaculum aggregatum TaxID=3036245 RepID=A0ABQ6LD60_9RHOB|nr:class I SAM-dependent methyltransferase [Limibaculum sp. NKW23]GMG81303.1 hypothetical protein LNKW23_05160 [Limibaculum sp. NKW23]